MFTPPPSPLPPVRQAPECDDHGSDEVRTDPPEDARISSKRKIHNSILWTIVVVPLALVLLAAYTRFLAHPAVFDLFSTDGHHEGTTWTKVAYWSIHEPHQHAGSRLVKRSPSRGLVVRSTSTLAPTVPTSPVLPNPFPQPFDTTLSANFSTNSCYDFFLNMTQADAFRSCRPFSLLLATSHAFSMAQNDINLMNADVWGTCNTDISQVQCDANMSWFASSLQTSCQTDLENRVDTAVATLNALQAYELMRGTACQVDPATNSYCYVEAVADTDTSSYWFYQLPLGQSLPPKITTNACNECTSGLMAIYSSALSNGNGTSLRGLGQTYNTAADTLNKVCGATYAKNAQVSTSGAARTNTGVPRTGWLVTLSMLFAAVLCGS